MVRALPVPLTFSLPNGWRSINPDEVNQPELAFVALKETTDPQFTPNISISGQVSDESDGLRACADQALDRIRNSMTDVRPGERSTTESVDDPAITQGVAFKADVNGSTLDLVQMQVFLGMRDTNSPRRMAITEVVLTAEVEQFADLVSPFQDFIRTIRVDTTGPNGQDPS